MVELDHLSTYLPKRVLNAVASPGAVLPRVDRFPAAILFADISGFTDLSDRLGRKGQEGTEEFTTVVNTCFRTMLGPVGESGGDVLTMAGDALVVFWESPDEASLQRTVERAVQCAMRIQQAVAAAPADEKLTVRIGIGAGLAELHYVGGQEDRWEFFPAGEPFRQMGLAEGHARPGEVVVSPEAWRALGSSAHGTEIEAGFMKIEESRAPSGSSPGPAQPLTSFERATVSALLPKPIRFLLSEAGEHWLADMRPVTSLFIHVHGEGSPSLETMQKLAEAVQAAVHRFEGTISGTNLDEKGLNLMLTFGLPPASHEDDPFRATQAALAIRGALRVADLPVGFGIATGRVYCGVVGGAERREFAVIGRTVNLAARLAHQSQGDILCDETTFQAAASRAQFSAAAPLRLKGLSKAIPIFIPTGLAAAGAGPARMVGHQAEVARLSQAIEDVKTGTGFTVVVEGEAGIGKSTLLHLWTQRAASAGVLVLRGAAESIHATTPYFPWRAIIGRLLGLTDGSTLEEKRAQFFEASRGRDWDRLAPLLNDILDLGIPDNTITEQITGKIRADNTRELVARLVGAAASSAPLSLVLEDGHWMDSASLAMALVVAQRVPALVLLLSTRVLTGEKERQIEPFLALPGALRMRLEPLPREDCVALAAQRLGVRRLAKPVADLIAAKSQGNPFFSVEIAFALRENGFVLIAGDECQPVPGLDLSTVKFPDNVQGIIMRRVDGLEPTVQLTAKVASVVGSTFSAPLLRDAFPAEAIDPHVEAHLEILREERLVASEHEPEYTFTHAIVEEAIYDRLLVTQRKTLHERVALALEKGSAEIREAAAPLLGHHWLRAGDGQKAGHYFGVAGQRAVHNGAYQEGLDFLTRAMELTPSIAPPTPEEALRDGLWQIMRAEAFFGLGRIEESGKAFREAARLLGRPVPENPETGDLLRQAGRRLLRTFTGTKNCPEADAGRVRLLAVCYEMIALLELFSNRMNSSMNAAFESLAQAERLGDSPEYARALATMALATSLVPAPIFANRYAKSALTVAAHLGHESTTARVREFLGMYQLGEGRWTETEEHFLEAIKGFQIVGDRRREIECTCLYSTWNHYRGDFPRRVELGRRVFDLACATGDLQAQAWGLLDQIESLLNLGDFERVGALGRDLKHHIGHNIYGADEIMAFGLLAALEMRTGRLAEAMPYAEKALAVMTKVSPTIVYNLESYAAVADVYLKAWRLSTETDPTRAEMMKKARAACESTRRFAKVFRIGSARAQLVTAVEAELAGDARTAIRLTREGLATATQLDMPYEKAVAHRQLARLLPRDDRSREGQLAQARDLFARMAAKYDLGALDV